MIKHSLFQKIDGRSIELLVSVSGDQISAALFYFQQGALPEKLFEVKEEIAISKTEPFFNRAALGKSLETILESVIKGGKGMYDIQDLFRDHQKIHRVEIMVTAPWISYKAREGKVALEKPEKINDSTVAMLLAEPQNSDRAMIDRTVHEMKLNGYPVSPEQYQNHVAKTIEIGYVDSFMLFADYNTIVNALNKSIGVEQDQISWISGLSVLHYNSFVAYEHPFPDYRMMLVNSFGIEEFIISDGNIKKHTHISFGKGSLIEELVKHNIANDPGDAKVICRSYLSGHLSKKLTEKINIIISDMINGHQLVSKSPTFVLSEQSDLRFVKKTVPESNLINLKKESEREELLIDSEMITSLFNFLNR